MDQSDAFLPEFWQLFLQTNLTALGMRCRTACAGSTMRRMLVAAADKERRPKLEAVNLSKRHLDVGVPGVAS